MELAEEQKDEMVKVNEILDIVGRMRLPTTSPTEHARGIITRLNERYSVEAKIKIVAYTTWPGDYRARSKLEESKDIESLIYTLECLALEKGRKRKPRPKSNHENK